MRDVGRVFRSAGLGRILLVHGTFVGPDALGGLGELERVWPDAARFASRWSKAAVDAIAGDWGNYTEEYACVMQSALAGNGQSGPLVERFTWSGENHHLGRVVAAVRLIDLLATIESIPTKRVLLWGHSHAGNVFALVTNLLGGDQSNVDHLFAAAGSYYRWPAWGALTPPVWRRVVDVLHSERREQLASMIDMVDFGTPIRYGWESRGYGRLLHFVNHRPSGDRPEFLAGFPPSPDDLREAAGGDVVQQIGIAGTDAPPSWIRCWSYAANRRLGRLLERGAEPEGLTARLLIGARVPDEGTTLLVDYGPPAENPLRHAAGHAVYTRMQWMLFHAETVAREFYGAV